MKNRPLITIEPQAHKKLNPSLNRGKTEWKEKDCQGKLVTVFRIFKDQNISVANLRQVMEYIFCLPGTSAFAERAFSMMSSIWLEEKRTIKKSRLEGLLISKLNIGLSRSEFCSKIRNSF